MLLVMLRIIVTLLHAAMIFGLAPLLMGMVSKFRARLLGRSGAPILQPYRDLWKLIHKVPLIPDTATELYKFWPFVSFAAIACIAFMVPGFCAQYATAPMCDFITLVGLFELSRAATMLAGLETGFGFGGAGAGRDALFSIFSEAALLVMVLIFVLITGDPTVDGIAQYFASGQFGISVSMGFALAAILAVALTETGRIPVDNPAGHLELGMVHEAMLLEYSGRYLAIFHYTACLRLMVWFSLLGTVFFPFGMAQAGAVLSWPGGLVLWFVKLNVFAVALSLFEVSTAKMRVFRVPEFLGVAMLLGLLSAIFFVRCGAARRMTEIYPLAHLLGGLMLLCAFALLSQRRLSAMITIYQVEALVLSAAAFWQGFAQHAAELYLTGVITMSIKAILLPMALRRIVHRFNLIRAVETAMPVGLSMILGVGLIGIAVMVVLPTTTNSVTLTREDLAISLSVVLLGLLVMTTRRNALSQVIGFLSTENGLVLAAIGMPGMPFVAELSVALLVLLAFLVVGVFVFRIREHFDTLDLSGIEEIERRGR